MLLDERLQEKCARVSLGLGSEKFRTRALTGIIARRMLLLRRRTSERTRVHALPDRHSSSSNICKRCDLIKRIVLPGGYCDAHRTMLGDDWSVISTARLAFDQRRVQ